MEPGQKYKVSITADLQCSTNQILTPSSLLLPDTERIKSLPRAQRSHKANELLSILSDLHMTITLIWHSRHHSFVRCMEHRGLTLGYCCTGISTRSDSLMFLLLMISKYFFTSPSFLNSSPSNFSISKWKKNKVLWSNNVKICLDRLRKSGEKNKLKKGFQIFSSSSGTFSINN